MNALIKKPRRLLALVIVLLLLLSAAGAYLYPGSAIARTNNSASEKADKSSSSSKGDKLQEYSMKFDTKPHAKPDGTKYRFSYVDYDEYLPASRSFYFILKGLEGLGWIKKGSIPFTTHNLEESNMSAKTMYELLQEADLGDYIEFVDGGFFFLAYDDESVVAETLKQRAGKDIDYVLASGTNAGVFVKSLELPIPMFDYTATDPVASGIIDSTTEGSGNPNVWAEMEPDVPQRQLNYYFSVVPFYKTGIVVYGDETISGIPDIKKAAAEKGIELVVYNIEEQPRETPEQLDQYYDLVADQIKKMSAERIDSFILAVDLINDLDRLAELLEPLYQNNIPVYTLDDVETIKHGGMMLVSCNDSENMGIFIAETIAKTMNGADAGMLPCLYYSSPSIYYNYTVGNRIHYPVQFEFLVACDQIFK